MEKKEKDSFGGSELLATILGIMGAVLLTNTKKGVAANTIEAIIKNKEQIAGWMLPFSLDDEALMAKVKVLVGPEDWKFFEFLLGFMDRASRDRVRHMIYEMDNPTGQKVKILAKDEMGNPILDKDRNPTYTEVMQEFSEHDLRVRYVRAVARDVREAIVRAEEALKGLRIPESEKTPELLEALKAREIRLILEKMKLTGEYCDNLPIQRAKRLGQRVLSIAKDPGLRARVSLAANGAYLAAKETLMEEKQRRQREINSIKGPFARLRRAWLKLIT
jgi:hypothetical protein